jgi:hypothetical protein
LEAVLTTEVVVDFGDEEEGSVLLVDELEVAIAAHGLIFALLLLELLCFSFRVMDRAVVA